MDGQDMGHQNRINKEVERIEKPDQFDFLRVKSK